jgi:hypothetical protein
MYEAFETESARKRIQLAKRALNTSQRYSQVLALHLVAAVIEPSGGVLRRDGR